MALEASALHVALTASLVAFAFWTGVRQDEATRCHPLLLRYRDMPSRHFYRLPGSDAAGTEPRADSWVKTKCLSASVMERSGTTSPDSIQAASPLVGESSVLRTMKKLKLP